MVLDLDGFRNSWLACEKARHLLFVDELGAWLAEVDGSGVIAGLGSASSPLLCRLETLLLRDRDGSVSWGGGVVLEVVSVNA